MNDGLGELRKRKQSCQVSNWADEWIMV
jgi:hypothetical protein